MRAKLLFVTCMALVGTAALSQSVADAPEWTEERTPAPPAFSKDQLIPIEMPPYVTIRIGIDPQTVAVGADGVVRYVVVTRNTSGSVSAAYEGIRCTSGEVKTYARMGSSGSWLSANQPEWRAMTDNLPSRHAYAIAHQGACDGRTAATREDILRSLTQRLKASN